MPFAHIGAVLFFEGLSMRVWTVCIMLPLLLLCVCVCVCASAFCLFAAACSVLGGREQGHHVTHSYFGDAMTYSVWFLQCFLRPDVKQQCRWVVLAFEEAKRRTRRRKEERGEKEEPDPSVIDIES